LVYIVALAKETQKQFSPNFEIWGSCTYPPCIRIGEVAASLKQIKRHKAPGLSGLTAAMIQATNIDCALCSTPQSLADAHYCSAVQ